MIADLILLAILGLAALLGYWRGLLDMLVRAGFLVLSLGLSLLLLKPVSGLLTRIPGLAALADGIARPVISAIAETATSIEEVIERFALPPILEALMKARMPAGQNVTQALPELTEQLFQFAVKAVVFMLLFVLLSILVHLLARLLTHWLDRLPVLGKANRIGGLLIGIAMGLLVINIGLFVAGLLAPYFPGLIDLIGQSWLAQYLYLVNFLIDMI